VSSDRDELERLNQQTGWTPGREATRPPPEDVAHKATLFDNVVRRYDTVRSYVLHRIFRLSASSRGSFSSSLLFVSDETLREAQRTAAEREAGARRRKTVFCENLFPYDLPEGTRHCVLWLLLDADESDATIHITDAEITELLNSELSNCETQFVWYRNPKPSVLDNVSYHVQVFVKD
jgi:hypothetical protein